MIVTQVCAAIIIEDLKYWMDLLPCRWLKTAVTVAQNLREDGSLSPEYTGTFPFSFLHRGLKLNKPVSCRLECSSAKFSKPVEVRTFG